MYKWWIFQHDPVLSFGDELCPGPSPLVQRVFVCFAIHWKYPPVWFREQKMETNHANHVYLRIRVVNSRRGRKHETYDEDWRSKVRWSTKILTIWEGVQIISSHGVLQTIHEDSAFVGLINWPIPIDLWLWVTQRNGTANDVVGKDSADCATGLCIEISADVTPGCEAHPCSTAYDM
jgi:hypothetical protein